MKTANNISPKICSRCICDTSIPRITFDKMGMCNMCHSYDTLVAFYKKEKEKKTIDKVIAKIKKEGEGKTYDCIIGVSGGTDGTYTLLLAKRLGLRPLAVHFDNGWNKEVAQKNIRKACEKLGIDLSTHVVNWEEFKDLQLSFLKASVPDLEVPTDIGIHGTLYQTARKEGIKYILSGSNFGTEGTVPPDWSYIDGTYLLDVHKKFGTKKLKTFPNATIWKIAQETLVSGMRQIDILNYFDYSKEEARKELRSALDWEYYGGHHYENHYTHLALAYIIPRKFSFDRRTITLSADIRAGRTTREEALRNIAEPIPFEEGEVDYCLRKLGISRGEFEEIMGAPNKSFRNYRSSYNLLRLCKPIIRLLARLHIISPVVYQKYTYI